jgi:hypothetical protein
MPFEASQDDVHLILTAFMFPRFTQIILCLFAVEDCVLVHPALHVSLRSTCVYISPFPPTSGSDNIPASRDFFSIVINLLWRRTFAFEDAPSVLSECLCSHVFRFGLTPNNPSCIISELNKALLVIWA